MITYLVSTALFKFPIHIAQVYKFSSVLKPCRMSLTDMTMYKTAKTYKNLWW